MSYEDAINAWAQKRLVEMGREGEVSQVFFDYDEGYFYSSYTYDMGRCEVRIYYATPTGTPMVAYLDVAEIGFGNLIRQIVEEAA